MKNNVIKEFPIYYGWVIMLIGTLGMIMTGPGQTYVVSIFIDHFIKDLSLSRSLVSTLYTVATIIGGLSLPYVGKLIDKYGPRKIKVLIITLFGSAAIYMGFIKSALMLFIGFILIRMLGQGSLGIVSTNVINQWWVYHRGKIIGISGVLVALIGIGGLPNFINWLIPIYGWRITYMILGFMLLVIMLPLTLIFIRNKPEEFGLKPDGKEHKLPKDKSQAKELKEENWTLKQALNTKAFWIFTLGNATNAMIITGLLFHMVSIFNDNGLSSNAAASVYLPISITIAIVTLISGVLIDRVEPKYLLSFGLLLIAIALIYVQNLSSVNSIIIYGIILGSIFGSSGIIARVIYAKYFGRKHLGKISGTASTVMVFGSSLGPMPLGIARDILGSYNTPLTILAIIPLILTILSLFVKRPTKN